MGLREQNAERTRAHLIDVAIELFFTQGYEQTTMEQIAERADVGSTTLYRYFPSKDLLLLHLFSAFDWGGALRARPADEAVNLSLRLLLRDTLESLSGNPDTGRLRQLIDEIPVARARILDIAYRELRDLEMALAERTGRTADDFVVTFTARMMYQIWEIAFDRWWSGDHAASPMKVLDQILASLHERDFILPAYLESTEASD
jgi:AcrR family transcriptional regulator